MSIDEAETARRALAGRIGALKSWAATADPSTRTAPARQAFAERFYDEVDPNRDLPEEERERRAAFARRAYFAELAYKSAQARRERSTGSPAPRSATFSGAVRSPWTEKTEECTDCGELFTKHGITVHRGRMHTGEHSGGSS